MCFAMLKTRVQRPFRAGYPQKELNQNFVVKVKAK